MKFFFRHFSFIALSFFSVHSATAHDAAIHEPTKQENLAVIPESIDRVQVSVVNNHLVRVIQHNMELEPLLQFEIMERPDFHVIRRLDIREVPFEERVLKFNEGSGAYIEKVELKKKSIEIQVDYYYLKAGSVLLDCRLTVENNQFTPLTCKEHPQE